MLVPAGNPLHLLVFRGPSLHPSRLCVWLSHTLKCDLSWFFEAKLRCFNHLAKFPTTETAKNMFESFPHKSQINTSRVTDSDLQLVLLSFSFLAWLLSFIIPLLSSHSVPSICSLSGIKRNTSSPLVSGRWYL